MAENLGEERARGLSPGVGRQVDYSGVDRIAGGDTKDFLSARGITPDNPYGNQGFFTRVFGIPADQISYANLQPRARREGIAALAYDRYMNPYARTNVLGGQTRANPNIGQVRYGLGRGDQTQFGPVVGVDKLLSPGRAAMQSVPGIAGLLASMAPRGQMNMIEERAAQPPFTGNVFGAEIPTLPSGVPSAQDQRVRLGEEKRSGVMYSPLDFIKAALGMDE